MANNSSRQYFALARGVAARGGVTSFNRSNRSKEARSGHPPLSSLLLHLPGRGGGSRQELLHKPKAHEKWQECPSHLWYLLRVGISSVLAKEGGACLYCAFCLCVTLCCLSNTKPTDRIFTFCGEIVLWKYNTFEGRNWKKNMFPEISTKRELPNLS